MVVQRSFYVCSGLILKIIAVIPLISRFGLRNTPKHPIVAATLLNSVRGLHASPVLCAEPLKKKKKIDPAVIKARDDRRKKKIEKQIRRLEKNARQLKAIDELEVPLVLIDEKASVDLNCVIHYQILI